MFYPRSRSVVKCFTILSIVVILGFACNAAAFADENNGSTSPTSAGTSSNAAVPTRVLGAVVGTVVGTPICFVRRSIWDEKDAIHGIIGDSNNKLAVVSAGAFWLPFGLATGFLEAPFYSFKHSMCNTNKPFSKEQFSLGEDDQ